MSTSTYSCLEYYSGYSRCVYQWVGGGGKFNDSHDMNRSIIHAMMRNGLVSYASPIDMPDMGFRLGV